MVLTEGVISLLRNAAQSENRTRRPENPLSGPGFWQLCWDNVSSDPESDKSASTGGTSRTRARSQAQAKAGPGVLRSMRALQRKKAGCSAARPTGAARLQQ